MMKNILLLGAGRSASVLIDYLDKLVKKENWHLTIADVTIEHLKGKKHLRIIPFQIQDEDQLQQEVQRAQVVISMLPAHYHTVVAQVCLQERKHLVTASYVSQEVREMNAAAHEAGLLFLMECGLDPGIDHMSALELIHNIREQEGEITSFKSYTGGLIAPESDTNPWQYKFTWNPRNVVVAGQGTAKYLAGGQFKYIPYHQLFTRSETLEVENWGTFEGYPNRDSLGYQVPYGLQHIETLVRGTLRRAGFCAAWDILVQLGLTDDSYHIKNSAVLTYRDFIVSFLPTTAAAPSQNWLNQIAAYLNIPVTSPALEKVGWLEFPEEPINMAQATPAQVLEKLLLQKWALLPQDKDMVVMQHILEYWHRGKKKKVTSSLVVLGDNHRETAMAKTVGLPVGIAVKLILQDKISQRGVIIPTHPEVYTPILRELETWGIKFSEKTQDRE